MKKLLLNVASIAMVMFVSASAFAQTAGTMTFTITTPKHASGNYETNGRYALAVWIESCTTCGAGTTVGTSTFVKTNLRYWGSNTNDHLPTWASKSGSSTTGATTGATSTVFTARTVTWDGKNAAGTTLLADGNYRVCVQETWGHGSATATRYFPFVKGTAIYNNTTDVTADTNFTGITLNWTPSALTTETFANNPEAVVYPNPTKGVFTIDFKSEIKNIKVVNILGEVVYNENIDAANAETTKKIDLSNFTNGVYIVNVSNDKGESSYKIVLDK